MTQDALPTPALDEWRRLAGHLPMKDWRTISDDLYTAALHEQAALTATDPEYRAEMLARAREAMRGGRSWHTPQGAK